MVHGTWIRMVDGAWSWWGLVFMSFAEHPAGLQLQVTGMETVRARIGVYKDGIWYLDWNGNGVWDGGMDKVYYFGTLGWTPVVGNWNGDGTGNRYRCLQGWCLVS